MRKETEELLHEIETNEDIRMYLDCNEEELLRESAMDFLNRKLHEKELSVSDVIKKSNNNAYLYKVFEGERRASRDILICIAFGLGLSIGDTQTLLRLSSTARLDPRNRRDAVTLYCISKSHDLDHLNELLFDIHENEY